jgi:hypothetical protein
LEAEVAKIGQEREGEGGLHGLIGISMGTERMNRSVSSIFPWMFPGMTGTSCPRVKGNGRGNG